MHSFVCVCLRIDTDMFIISIIYKLIPKCHHMFRRCKQAQICNIDSFIRFGFQTKQILTLDNNNGTFVNDV